MHRSRGLQHQTFPVWAMPLPDEQELDWKRPIVSLVAVQRSQTVSHKQPARQGVRLLKDTSISQPNLRRKLWPHGVLVKRQRLFRTPSSQRATSCPPASDASGPSQKKIQWPSLWRWLSKTIKQLHCRYCTQWLNILLASKVKAITKGHSKCSWSHSTVRSCVFHKLFHGVCTKR